MGNIIVGAVYLAIEGDPGSLSFENIRRAVRFDCRNKKIPKDNLDFLKTIGVSKMPWSNDNLAIKIAAENGLSEVMRTLLEIEKVNPKTNDNHPLLAASKNGHLEIIQLLLPRIHSSALFDGKFLVMAVKNHQLHVAQAILQHNNNIPYSTYSDEQVMKILVMSGLVDPTGSDYDPIEMAAYFNHYALLQMMLEDYRVDPKSIPSYILKRAASRSNKKVVQILLFHGVDPCPPPEYYHRPSQDSTEITFLLQLYPLTYLEQEQSQITLNHFDVIDLAAFFAKTQFNRIDQKRKIVETALNTLGLIPKLYSLRKTVTKHTDLSKTYSWELSIAQLDFYKMPALAEVAMRGIFPKDISNEINALSHPGLICKYI